MKRRQSQVSWDVARAQKLRRMDTGQVRVIRPDMIGRWPYQPPTLERRESLKDIVAVPTITEKPTVSQA